MKVPEFLHGAAQEAAPLLLGWQLVSKIGGLKTAISLTEVEAYGPDDPASHSYKGVRPRTKAMFGPAGRLYVYRSYGVHWCANVVCGVEGVGAGVLLRAGALIAGADLMRNRRGRVDRVATGPGNLTQALGITGEHGGVDLFDPRSPVRLVPGHPPDRFGTTPRIGVSRGVETPWRFVILDTSVTPGTGFNLPANAWPRRHQPTTSPDRHGQAI